MELRVRLEDIPPEGVTLLLDVDPPGLDLAGSEDARPSGNIRGEASVTKAGKKIRVRLSLDFAMIIPCSRCLRETEHHFSESGEFTLIPTPPAMSPEQRLEEEDFTTQFFSGEEIDLAPLVREMVILSVPVKPLCKPDCKGLCPVCGADRNEEGCEHATVAENGEATDSRWSKLRELRNRKK